MKLAKFTIVTATAGQYLSEECFKSWHARRALDGCGGVLVAQVSPGRVYNAGRPLYEGDQDTLLVIAVPDYLGPVPAFRLGVDLALQITEPDGIIACLHDDLLIEEDGWDARILEHFNNFPSCGLLGFGGGTGLGSDDIYKAPYSPMQLARQDFVSNMRDAEAHGRRSRVPVEVACLDGFSQVGRAAFWRGLPSEKQHQVFDTPGPLTRLESKGVIHHAYDAYLGAFAHYRGWDVWMLPIACHHYGGRTAVADAGYQGWARQQTNQGGKPNESWGEGDAAFWQHSHRIVYDLCRGILPLRVPRKKPKEMSL